MIDKREILEQASALKLLPHVVEKDYVLGWILGGIYANAALVDSWVFKGGTCLKKCYFETYRFSEDLDFTLLDATGPVPVAESAEHQRSTGPKRPTRSMGSGAVNVFYCGVCGKKFQRKSMDYTLNPHKDPSGYPCYGRRGVFDHTKHS